MKRKLSVLIIIIKRISRAPFYHTRWQHRVLYSNTNHTHTHRVSDEGMGRAVKNSLEIIIKQVCLEGGFERGGRIRVAECLRQTVGIPYIGLPVTEAIPYIRLPVTGGLPIPSPCYRGPTLSVYLLQCPSLCPPLSCTECQAGMSPWLLQCQAGMLLRLLQCQAGMSPRLLQCQAGMPPWLLQCQAGMLPRLLQCQTGMSPRLLQCQTPLLSVTASAQSRTPCYTAQAFICTCYSAQVNLYLLQCPSLPVTVPKFTCTCYSAPLNLYLLQCPS